MTPAEIDSVTFSVQTLPADGGAPPDARAVGPVMLGDVPARPLTLGVTPASDALDPVLVTVVGRRSNTEVVRRAIRVPFVRGETHAVPLLLARRCAGVVCNGGVETCSETAGCRRIDARPEDTPLASAYCAPGTADCDQDLGSETSNGCEADTRTSTAHCGRCGHACAAGEACDAGVCAGERVVELAAGGAHSCALRASGALACWGLNGNGQLGTGSFTTASSATPQTVTTSAMGFTGVVEVAAGARHTCARTRAGLVFCWGLNTSGQLGAAAGMNQLAVPTQVAGTMLPPFAQLALGESHSCARTQETTSRLFCWGSDANGQLGNGTMMGSTSRPTEVALLPDLLDVAAGYRYTCVVARTPAGGMQCWGQNNAGQLGVGNTSTQQAPASVTIRNGSFVATSLAAGEQHTCAHAMDNKLYCWGDNTDRQLGDGSTIDARNAPDALARVIMPSDFASVSAGNNFTCGVRTSGELHCWGANDRGELGRNTTDTTDRATTAPVAGPRDFVQVVAGAQHVCARRGWGGVMCWGENGSGQVGDGSTTQRVRPVFVSGLP